MILRDTHQAKIFTWSVEKDTSTVLSNLEENQIFGKRVVLWKVPKLSFVI